MKYTVERLSNDCSVVYHYSNSSLCHLGVAFKVGSRDENQEKKLGIAHLLEHTVFLGSTRFSNTDIEKYSKEICCDFDAITTKEVTLFNMTLLEQFFENGIDLLLNVTLSPTFPVKLFLREKGVVKNEIDRHNSSIKNMIYDDIMATLFENHSLANPILGEWETIDNIQINDIIFFHKQYYTPNNMTFYYSGNVEIDQLKAVLVDKTIKRSSFSKKRMTNHPLFIPAQHKTINKSDIEIIDVAIFGYAPEVSHKRYMVFLLLKEILSSNMGNGVLLKQLRDRHGLIYNLEMEYTSFSDTAIWNIRYKCRANDSTNIFGIILHVLTNILKYISPQDLVYYKRCLLINVLRQEENRKKCLISDVISMLSLNGCNKLLNFSELLDVISIEDIISESEVIFSKQNINYKEYYSERLSR